MLKGAETMKLQILALGGAILAQGLLMNAANAAGWSTQPYQAEYSQTSPSGQSVHKLAYDGKGHGRSEIISARRHAVSLLDIPNHKMTILMDDLKSAVVVAITDDDVQKLGDFGARFAATGKSIGVKIIDGHLCEGTFYQLGSGVTQELWNGKDVGGVRVYSKVSDPHFGITETRLKTYLPVAPAAQAFTVPAGYRQ
jgi:hypothetical protein